MLETFFLLKVFHFLKLRLLHLSKKKNFEWENNFLELNL